MVGHVASKRADYRLGNCSLVLVREPAQL